MYALLLVATWEVKVSAFIKGLEYHISGKIVAHDKEPMEYILDLALKWE